MQWQGQEILKSNSSNNSWNMMSTTVRVVTMNKLQQNKTKQKRQSNKLRYRCMVLRVSMIDDEWSRDC
jgi:hypothetical protein